MIKVHVNAKQNPDSIIEYPIFSIYRGSKTQTLALQHTHTHTHTHWSIPLSSFHSISMHRKMPKQAKA